MIRRSLLVALVLALGYALFLRVVKVDWDTTQHLANGNRIKAEKFIFAAPDSFRTVIIGSSLAYLFDLDSFPARTANLGFAGMSIYDGAELILRSGKRPSVVLLETNILFRKPDAAFLDALFAPGIYQLHRAVPMMREQNQPSGVLYGWLRAQGRGMVPAPMDTTDTATPSMLERVKQDYAKLPEAAEQRERMDMLAGYVGRLEAAGAEVRFFEAPVNPVAGESPLADLQRKLLQERFPDHPVIRVPPGSRWRTSDGLHLIKADANRFSGVLARAAGLR